MLNISYTYVSTGDHDPYNYCPIRDGIGASTSRMPRMGKETNPYQIEVDSKYGLYLQAKKVAREQFGVDTFYQRDPRLSDLALTVARARLDSLVREGKAIGAVNHQPMSEAELATFKPADDFDALCCQIQEDVVLMTLVDGIPTATIIHLNHPNGWSAEGAIGKDFAHIHEEVKNRNGSQVVKHANRMASALIEMPHPVERVGAISFRTNTILNRHPNIRLPEIYNAFDPENPQLYMRFERQTITPIPEIYSFLFTIKTYFYDVFMPGREELMLEAFSNIHTDAYSRWWLDGNAETVCLILKERISRGAN